MPNWGKGRGHTAGVGVSSGFEEKIVASLGVSGELRVASLPRKATGRQGSMLKSALAPKNAKS